MSSLFITHPVLTEDCHCTALADGHRHRLVEWIRHAPRALSYRTHAPCSAYRMCWDIETGFCWPRKGGVHYCQISLRLGGHGRSPRPLAVSISSVTSVQGNLQMVWAPSDGPRSSGTITHPALTLPPRRRVGPNSAINKIPRSAYGSCFAGGPLTFTLKDGKGRRAPAIYRVETHCGERMQKPAFIWGALCREEFGRVFTSGRTGNAP